MTQSMPWLLIDGGWLAYRCLWPPMGDLEIKQGMLLTFSFLDQLRVICCDHRCKSNRVGLFFDSRERIRREIFPEYKAYRAAKTKEEAEKIAFLWGSISIAIKEIFPTLGVPTYQKEGYEADDLIASACASLGGDRAIILTSDNDLYQLITDQVHWYDSVRQRYHTPMTFAKEKGIAPDQWAGVKSIAGCSGDGVPGVGGVGEKTAIQYLQKKLPPGSSRVLKIECPRGQEIIGRNLKLVKLPYRGTGEVRLREPRWDLHRFKVVCEQRGLGSFVNGIRYHEWLKVVTGRFSATDVQRSLQRIRGVR